MTLELIDLAREVIKQLPTGYGFLADQLRRAAASVSLNFAEGCAKDSIKERRRFFNIARGSACEVAAVLDVGLHFRVVSPECRLRGQLLCDHLGGMLTKFR